MAISDAREMFFPCREEKIITPEIKKMKKFLDRNNIYTIIKRNKKE
jgi:hypothetical protein